jgi:uncharacterized protein YqhQ
MKIVIILIAIPLLIVVILGAVGLLTDLVEAVKTILRILKTIIILSVAASVAHLHLLKQGLKTLSKRVVHLIQTIKTLK